MIVSNSVKIKKPLAQDGPLYVIVEYAEHGNLRDFLRKFHNSQGSANIGRPPNLTLRPRVMQKKIPI